MVYLRKEAEYIRERRNNEKVSFYGGPEENGIQSIKELALNERQASTVL